LEFRYDKFKRGDKVSFSNQTGEGIITAIVNDELVKVDMGDGFKTPVLIKELIKIPPEDIKNFQSEISEIFPLAHKEKNKKRVVSIKAGKRTKKEKFLPEDVDLHIGELIDEYTGMTNAEIVIIQLNHFRKCLDEAILNNKRKIIFIHGVGKGTLKSEMEKILKTYERISFYDASYARYGFGAMEVIIY